MRRRLERVERDATDAATHLFARQAAADFAIEVGLTSLPRTRAAQRDGPRGTNAALTALVGRALAARRAGGAGSRRRLATVRDPRAEVAATRVFALELRIQQVRTQRVDRRTTRNAESNRRRASAALSGGRTLAVEPASTFERRVASGSELEPAEDEAPTLRTRQRLARGHPIAARVALGEARSAASDRRLVERHRVRRQRLAETPHALVVEEARRHAATALRLAPSGQRVEQLADVFGPRTPRVRSRRPCGNRRLPARLGPTSEHGETDAKTETEGRKFSVVFHFPTTAEKVDRI
jgi:hypothetical protein